MARKSNRRPLKYWLRQVDVEGAKKWRFECGDCKETAIVDEPQFDGEKEFPCTCKDKGKKINFSRLTKINKEVRYELETAPGELADQIDRH